MTSTAKLMDSSHVLILTEKPSVARDFAQALQVKGKRTGYFEGSGFVITWAVGHLLELFAPGDYDRKWLRWDLRTLPIVPGSVSYRPIAQVQDQLHVIQGLLKRSDIGSVVIATDAGREGEVIARTILGSVDTQPREMFRFWTSQALTPDVVAGAMKQLKPASEYDRLWRAGQARQIADWLVGMNFSRAATLKCRGASNETFSVGRVQTAVLALLVDRQEARDHFKPEPYWLLKCLFINDAGSWRGSWFAGEESRFLKEEDARKVMGRVTGQSGRVSSVKKSKKSQPPPLLYSLTDLQRDANARHGFSAKEALDIAQALYEEKKCLSYPRTDARVLGTQNVELTRKIIHKLERSYPEIFQGVDPKLVSKSNKRVFDDARLTDHHALIPLAPLPERSPEREKKIYDLVLRRFAAAFHPKFEYEATEIVTEVKDETFRTRGVRPLVPGWKAVAQTSRENRIGDEEGDADEEQISLPPVKKNDPAHVSDCDLQQKMTQPPPEYNEALLLKDMSNPSRYVSEEDLQKIFKGEVGLGTQATRAQIIETLIKRQYIVRKSKKVLPTEKGCALVRYLRSFRIVRQVTLPEETARWEQDLERIAWGEGSVESFLNAIKKLVTDGIGEFQTQSTIVPPSVPLGKCPQCDGDVIEGRKGYGCSRWREADGGCRFVVWKQMGGRILWPGMVKRLLVEKELPPLMFESQEDGKMFSAVLRLRKDPETGKWSPVQELAGEEPEAGKPLPAGAALGLCPRSGGEVVAGAKGYGCSHWKEGDGGCRFIVWKTIAHREISPDMVARLLMKGETPRLEGFKSREGREFAAGLKLDPAGLQVVFTFD